MSKIFEKIIRFKQIPYLFNVSIIKPLVKDSKKSNSDANNLRPVAISDSISNIFEAILLYELDKDYIDNEKQFGFKKYSSCGHAIFVLKQAIKISRILKKKLYVCAIDASKAFDKVNRINLWAKLVEKNVKPAILIAIINYYNDSLMLIENENEYSNIFKTSLGVKQGGKISPKLFSIYIDGLIKEIEKAEPGLKIGANMKIDIIVYADDIILISTTKQGLNKQIKEVEKFGTNNEISYNPSKTTFMIFNNSVIRKSDENKCDLWQEELFLNEIKITQVKSMKYLGVIITEDDKNTEHINKRKKSVYAALAKIKTLGTLSNILQPNMKGQLYNAYIRPVLYYGIENFCLNKIEKLAIKRIEGNIIKNIFSIPKRCKSSELFSALKIDPTYTRLNVLKCDFFERLYTNAYTKKIIDYLELNQFDCFLIEIDRIRELVDNHFTSDLKRIDVCGMYKYIAQVEKKAKFNQDPKVAAILDVFKRKNSEETPKLLYNLLKFE